MPPKPLPPTDDMMSRDERGKRLETTIRGLIHHRAIKEAHQAFDHEWKRTILPHLPLRHPFKLTRLDKRGLIKLIEAREADQTLLFDLRQGVDPRNPTAVAVVFETNGVVEVVGFLGADEEKMLQRAGQYAKLYTPTPLQITGFPNGKLGFQMELVRPDLRQCSACDKLHTEDQINCEECRKKRRRKNKKSLEETAEQAPIPFQGAFRHLSREPLTDELL